jgi:hypothetical protein
LGVKISEAKSLKSNLGCLEFAKQFWVKQVQVNLSPVSARAVLAANNLVAYAALANQYSLDHRVLFRLAGAGYRVMSTKKTANAQRARKLLRA